MVRIILCVLATVPLQAFAVSVQDTVNYLEEATVSAYFVEQPLLRLPASAGVIGQTTLAQQSGVTLLPAVNTVPGVRMEERSPGSFRLSLRGSLLRSPFGVRNVKVYFDEIPLTDAGGNTYLNSLDAGSLDGVELLKGPDGSLFGANSGGVVLLRPHGMVSGGDNSAAFRINGGSYGLFHQQLATVLHPAEDYQFSINQAYQRADGYRQNSAMQRMTLQTVQRWQYKANSELRLLALYSDLRYRTPGGLTATQFADNPQLARPATGTVPGATEQQAGITNKTLVGGLVHDTQLSSRLRHVASIFGSHTDFSNPFITNYEIRDEYNMGFRTYFDYIGGDPDRISWRVNTGMEWQYGQNDISNYDNNGGSRGDEQATDALRSLQHFYFARFSADLRKRLFFESSLSLNYYSYGFKSVYPADEAAYTNKYFDAEWMPRAALSYLLAPQLAWRAVVSRGYSPPTIAEVRPSDQIVNTGLAAETGWNYETGFRWQTRDRRFSVDGSVFLYRMQDAIIRQLREDGAEFFGNAGSVKQRGVELSVDAWMIEPRQTGWMRGLQVGSSLALSKFRFGDYQVGDNDFGGNRLTGVPATTVVSHLSMRLPLNIEGYLMHNFTSSIPLNDANSVFADAYQLLQAKASWSKPIGNNLDVQLFVGADNLLNQLYSLGNDINAFGGRFFNAAPPRSFYGGLAVRY